MPDYIIIYGTTEHLYGLHTTIYVLLTQIFVDLAPQTAVLEKLVLHMLMCNLNMTLKSQTELRVHQFSIYKAPDIDLHVPSYINNTMPSYINQN